MNIPHDSMDIMALLRGSEAERKEGVRLLFELEFIRQYAFYWYRRYLPRIANKYPEWEDLYMESIFGLINEVDEGRGPRTNVKGYFSRLCQNMCEKALRDLKEDEAFDQVISGLLGASDSGYKLRAWIENILSKMECKCETLLRWRYLQTPPVKDKEQLAALLQDECGSKKNGPESYSPIAIPVHLHDCRNKFRGLAGTNPFDFDDN
ncbi:MAG: sigma-70 family RNA polymerase sigma factor [Saprospiraceae bacterium]|nr:sigma-70 family RNA polymerase sigma factor [Saprospiraceae bacterium]